MAQESRLCKDMFTAEVMRKLHMDATPTNRKTAERTVAAVMAVIKEQVAAGKYILTTIGTFYKAQRKARSGFSNITGTAYATEAHSKISLRNSTIK